MAENHSCSGDCSSCGQSCSSRDKQSFLEPTGEYNNIKNVIAVVSGKGGVGKSMVTSLLAVLMAKKGYKVGILDADITGPSIPKAFGIKGRAMQNELGILPAVSKGGIKIMSVNLLLPETDSPVVWRGPVIAGAVKQFWQEVVWEDLDYLFIDCPPGTGDVPLTVFQTIPLDGAVVVTTPQDLVGMIVRKAVNMAEMMNINVFGIVENMSYIECPDCKKKINIFGSLGLDSAADTGLSVLGKMPIDTKLTSLVDNGEIEKFSFDFLDSAVETIEKALKDKE